VTTGPLLPITSRVSIAGDGVAVSASRPGGDAPAQSPAGATLAQIVAQPSALQAAISAAVGQQGGLASLLADLSAALESVDLPDTVQATAQQVLALQLPLEPPPSAEDLQQAVAQSGLFLEAQLANADAPTDGDLKAALLSLGQALATSNSGSNVRAAAAGPAPAPPYLGGPTRGQPAVVSNLAQDVAPDVAMARLAKETGAAISRQVLMQAASAQSGARAPGDAAERGWLFEIPLATPQGASIAQFEIDRDGAADGQDEDEPVWRAKFSLDVDPMGPVHAKIAMSGGKVRVTLWAEDGETLDRLTQRQAELSDILEEEGLSAQVAVFPGAPSAAVRPPGGFTDRVV
jgi:hypothetical protein